MSARGRSVRAPRPRGAGGRREHTPAWRRTRPAPAGCACPATTRRSTRRRWRPPGCRRLRGARREAAPASPTDSGVPWPRRIDTTAASGTSACKRRGDRRAVDRDESGGAGHEPRHRPRVVEMVVEARDRELSRVRVGVGMIPGELGAVVVGAEPAEQGRGPRVVQMRVVQHGQAGIPEEVRPEVVVMRRVADLVDGQVVGVVAGDATRSRGPSACPAPAARPARRRRRRSRARLRRAATRSALQAATPVATGGIGLNQASRGMWAF